LFLIGYPRNTSFATCLRLHASRRTKFIMQACQTLSRTNV
jgi:hypothetical protein